MAKREQRSNRVTRKPKADKTAKVRATNANRLPVVGSDRKPSSRPKG